MSNTTTAQDFGLARIDKEIEATKEIIRSGGKSAERNAITALFGVDSAAAQVEEAMHRLMALTRSREKVLAEKRAGEQLDTW